MKPAYEQLKFYQELCDVRADVFTVFSPYRNRFPKLVTQLTDAMRSAKQNVIEGYGRDSLGSFIQHLKISRASLGEARGDIDDVRRDVPALANHCEEFLQRIDRILFLLDRYIDSLYRLERAGGWKTRWQPRSLKKPVSTPLVTLSNRPPASGHGNQANQGFTLLETLVASAIFTSIMLIGVATFSKVNRLNDVAKQYRSLSEAGRFVMSDLARAVVNATGTDCEQSLEFLTASGSPASPTDGQLVTGDGLTLKLTSVSDTGTVVEQYFKSGSQLMVKRTEVGIDQPIQPVTGGDVSVEAFQLAGVPTTNGALSQPFVTVKLTLKSTAAVRGTQPAAQTFESTTVSRDYRFKSRPAQTPTAITACKASL